MSYDAHYRAYKELQARFGWAVDKATHWHRATARHQVATGKRR